MFGRSRGLPDGEGHEQMTMTRDEPPTSGSTAAPSRRSHVPNDGSASAAAVEQARKDMLRDVRPRFPASMPDEEFLLRAVMPAEQVDAMMARRPAAGHYNPDAVPLIRLLEELKQRPRSAHFAVEKPGFKLRLKGRADAV